MPPVWSDGVFRRQTLFCFLAGGITAENLKEIKANPYLAGIDVSSGVETEGVKDGAKIKLFVKEGRRLQAEWKEGTGRR